MHTGLELVPGMREWTFTRLRFLLPVTEQKTGHVGNTQNEARHGKQDLTVLWPGDIVNKPTPEAGPWLRTMW